MNDKKKGLIRTAIESLVIFVLIFLLTITNLISPLNYLITDALYQAPRGISSNIKIIAIDEKTLAKYGRIDTWSRQVYADLIDTLNTYEDAKPSVIAFDITFSGNVEPEGDQAFADAAKKSGNVVVVSQFLYSQKPVYDENGLKYYPVEGIVNPYPELASAAARVGYANVSQDSDGTVRRIIPKEKFGGNEYPMFSEQIYREFLKDRPEEIKTVPTDKSGRTLINYSGKPGDYEAISLADLLAGKIDCRTFKNSIVLVGAYAAGMQDNFVVPNGGAKQMYGVEIHANILQSFLQERFSVPANPYICGLILGIIGAALFFAMRRSKVWISAIILLAGIGLELWIGTLVNNKGYSMSLLYFPLILFLSFVYSLVFSYLAEVLHKRKVMNAFKKYVAPEVVEEIAKKGDFQVKLGGENRDIAVLFVDIRGFTTMSEALEPEEVVDILNRYLNLTTHSIFNNKGTLDKFVGDATMAVFNSPFDLDDYEFRAVCAAMDIVAGGEAIEQEFIEKYGKSVGFGVGVNVGPAVVGNVGCDFRMDFTAIGDTVNTAARLEANAKRGQVLISDVLYERVKDRVEVEPVGEIPLKGKSKGVFVYSVTKVHR